MVCAPPMTVRAVRPAAAARSRKSANGSGARRLRSSAAAGTACVMVCGTPRTQQHDRACHAEAQSQSLSEGGRPDMKSCICFTCRNLFRDSRIGLQNAERQARLRAATGDFDVCSEREDVMRVPSGFGIGVLAVTLSALLTASASAQVDTGSITGTVKDQSGAIVPGATVTITHEGQGLTLTSVTREDGTYIFTPIRTGAYRIDVELQGFKKEARRGITVGIQEQVRARLRSPGRWYQRRGAGDRRLAAAADGIGDGRRDVQVRDHRKPAGQRPRLHRARPPDRRRRAAAARRARAADVRRQRRAAGARTTTCWTASTTTRATSTS